MNFQIHNLDQVDVDDMMKQPIVLVTFTANQYHNKRNGYQMIEDGLSFYVHDVALLQNGKGNVY
jgi:hypothetical protein